MIQGGILDILSLTKNQTLNTDASGGFSIMDHFLGQINLHIFLLFLRTPGY